MKLFRLSRKPGTGEEERQLVMDLDAALQAPAHDGTEAEESAPASEPADIPIQDLLSDLVGVSRRLGVTPPVRTEPDGDEARHANAEPDEDDEAPEPDGPRDSETERPSLIGYRRYALHGLLLSMALAAAIGGLMGFMGTEWLAHTGPIQGSPAQVQDDHSRPPIVVATVPGAAAGQEGQAETAPEPTPEPQPAYFLYTTQPGDAVFAIAETFAISPDYILWNNPDLIYDPNVVLIGEELLIPSVDGIIYRVKPGDTLSDIAALYQIDVETILAFAPNSLTSADNAIEGMVLILPGAVPPPSSHIRP
jgi:LysM repeat protein